MFLVGILIGLVVIAYDVRRPVDKRRRSMSEEEAIGYRAGLGEDSGEMLVRR